MAVLLHTADTVSARKMEEFKPTATEKSHKGTVCAVALVTELKGLRASLGTAHQVLSVGLLDSRVSG